MVKDGSSRHNECMVKSVEGVYRNGKVELIEPIDEAEGSRVIVTWVHPGSGSICASGASTNLKRRTCAAA